VILVDANVLIDVLWQDPLWFAWSSGQLAAAANAGPIGINAIVYAEISVPFSEDAALDMLVTTAGLMRLELPYRAGFLAGKAFEEYRRRGGVRTSPLPDFYIAAHAAVIGATLLTRDPSRHRSYFPSVPVIAP
jgi:predicted nucleic acid-binding protein